MILREFFFSGAFRMTQHSQPHDKLPKTRVDVSTAAWSIDNLSDRSQLVRLRACESDQVVNSKEGTSGDCPLTIPLQPGYLRLSRNLSLVMFRNTQSAVGFGCESSGQMIECRRSGGHFVTWRRINSLNLNVKRKKQIDEICN